MKVYKVLNITIALVMLVSFLVVSQPAQAQDSNGDKPAGDYMPGELVVVYKPGAQALEYGEMTRAMEENHGVRMMKAGPEGTALFAVDESRSLEEVKEELQGDPSVELVEYNYIYAIPELITTAHTSKLTEQYVLRPTAKGMEKEGVTAPLTAYPKDVFAGMKSVRGGKVTATWPTDTYLWDNNGWYMTGAYIVWPNTTASAGVCVLDTGVDYLHPDLSGRIIKGYDFVNADADPMDDFGHGTHVAGIITAVHNNGKGIAGASNAKVVAVKVLGSQGWGTSFDIASGIIYCANRTDVKVLNLSLGGSYSTQIRNAVRYAVNDKNKLVVAAAGNDDTYDTTYAYPAALSIDFPDKVLAVAASGMWIEDGDNSYNEYMCKADYSNYGDWISVVAPGSDILSTTPYDKPFYMNFHWGVETRYAYMSGTSMATPFAAAAAARRWGFKPTKTNAQVGSDLKNADLTPRWIYADDGHCWPAEMPAPAGPDLPNTVMVNVAGQLERGNLIAGVYDASTGLPLNGATASVYMGSTLQGSGVYYPHATKADPTEPDPSRIYQWYGAWSEIDIINLPVEEGCTVKANKTGYTNGYQNAYQQSWCAVTPGGDWWHGKASVPPKSTNFDVVTGWWEMSGDWGGGTVQPDWWDLDTNVWLPNTPNPFDAGQPSTFIVGPEGNSYGYYEGEPQGTLNAFPFARWKRDGGSPNGDWLTFEDTTIRSRLVHAPLAANAALPYYPGTYNVVVTDFGQTIDHDNDDLTDEIPMMGVISQPWVYIWKDGVVKFYNAMGWTNPGDACNTHYWKAASIFSGVTGTVTYSGDLTCGGSEILPYVATGFDASNYQFSK